MPALQGIRIIETAEGVAGEYCAKLLADFGAEVIKLERPGTGSPTRSMAPLLRDAQGRGTSGLFAYLNTNKQSLCLDLATAAGRDALRSLLAAADVVVDDHDPDWLPALGLGAAVLARDYPALVVAAITPYGQDAAREHWHARSLNVFHDSGWGYHTPTAADPALPPLKGPGRFLVDYEAGLEAALAIAAALYRQRQCGDGEFIDVAQRDAIISRADLVLGRLLAGEDEAGPRRTAYDQAGPSAFFPCADGAVYLYVTNQKHWRGLRELLGQPSWMAEYDDNWLEFGVNAQRVATFRTGFAAWVRDQHKVDVSNRAQRLGVPLVPVNDAADVQHSPQYVHRKFFQPLRHPVLGEALYPTVPYRMSATPATLHTPAPALGEHDAAMLDRFTRTATSVRGDRPAPATGSGRGPLAGVRVVEITKVWAGPYAGKLLAFLGAEVIKVESHTNMDELRAFGGVDLDHAPYFLSVNQEVLSVQANMKSEQGRAYVRELIGNADIVLNNLRPGAMERLGFSYDELQAIRPDIISVSIKMFGNDGPLGHQTGYAPCFSALGGMSYLVGYEVGPPMGINMRYGDATVGANAAFAAIVALLHRERTGEGQFVDVSAVECMSSMVGDSLLAYSLTGVVPGPDGNRHADLAPHGVYPCRKDEWLSLAVAGDDEWRRLCEILGAPQLAAEPDYATFAGRQAHATALDEKLAACTKIHDAAALAHRLRQAGIGAAKSLNTLDLVSDPELWRRETFRLVSDTLHGTRPVTGPGWRMSRAVQAITRGAPRLGEHNGYVYGEIMGLTPERIEQLVREQVIY